MYYIVLDMEFNQYDTFQKDSPVPYPYPKSSFGLSNRMKSKLPFEIIQIGAYKLDGKLNILSSFNRFIKPSIYESIDPRITEMTGITTKQLQGEKTFPEVYKDLVAFIQDKDSVFCTWGMSDMKVLFRNVKDFHLDESLLPRQFINIQPYVSLHLKMPKKKQLRLQTAIELLNLPMNDAFHDALHDAYYTALIFKQIYTPFMFPQKYDPTQVNAKVKPRQKKRVIDFDSLIKQFEKMYAREMTEDEIGMIQLAYKMGHTNQFIKLEEPSEEKNDSK